MDSSGWGGGGIFPPREGASRAVYGKGTDESLAPRKMKFQVLRFFLSSFPFSRSLPPPSNIVSGNCLCRRNFHARRGNKRLNFSRGTVRLFEINPFAVINAQGMKCEKKENKRKENFWIKRNYVI